MISEICIFCWETPILRTKNANKRKIKFAFLSLNRINAWKKICSFDFLKSGSLQKYLFQCMEMSCKKNQLSKNE